MKNLSDIKIGVLGGGVSPEREISLISANAAYKALTKRGLKAVLIDINSFQSEEVEKLLCSYDLDLAFIALHGAFGEDGGIQKILGSLAIPYTGSGPKASSLAMNKALSKDKFEKDNIPTPEFQIAHNRDSIPHIVYPIVVKPYCSGSSLGISIVSEPAELAAALDRAFCHQAAVLLENYIAGRELTVGILDDRPLGVVEIVPKSGYYDFKAKYCGGLTEFIAPAKIPEDIYRSVQALSLSAHKALGCRHFSRVDLRLNSQGKAYVLEVNSIPGLTAHSLLPLSAKVCLVEFDELILKMIELALRDSYKPKEKLHGAQKA